MIRYDFDKFLRSEASSRQSQDRFTISPENTEAHYDTSRSRSREKTSPRVWMRSPSEGDRQPGVIEKVLNTSKINLSFSWRFEFLSMIRMQVKAGRAFLKLIS